MTSLAAKISLSSTTWIFLTECLFLKAVTSVCYRRLEACPEQATDFGFLGMVPSFDRDGQLIGRN